MNKAFINAWVTIADKYNALSHRERLMVFVAGLVIIIGTFMALLFDPVMQKQKQLDTEISQLQSHINETSTQLAALTVNPVIDIDTQNREKLGSLKQTLQTQSEMLSGMNSALVTPDDMPALLEGLLAKHAAVKLVAMKTLAVENLFKQTTEPLGQTLVDTASSALGTPLFYKHNLEITLSGNYLDLLQYAEALERLSIHPLWSQAQLNVKDYPVSELKITLYTLSLDKTWLSI